MNFFSTVVTKPMAGFKAGSTSNMKIFVLSAALTIGAFWLARRLVK